MQNPTVIGVDPGLVHTGVVMLDFFPHDKELIVGQAVIDGLDADATHDAILAMLDGKPIDLCEVFIEWYRPRSGFSTDERMVQANATFSAKLSGTLTKNTGVKKIVSKQLMELCHVWSFETTTHHQDLRSAARIALLGMMLDPLLNRVLFDYAVENVDGKEWNVAAF